MATIRTLSTGIPADRPIPYAPSRCFDCGAAIPADLGRCFPCRLSVKLRAAAAALEEVQYAIRTCVRCAAAFGQVGPADGRLCAACAGEVRDAA